MADSGLLAVLQFLVLQGKDLYDALELAKRPLEVCDLRT